MNENTIINTGCYLQALQYLVVYLTEVYLPRLGCKCLYIINFFASIYDTETCSQIVDYEMKIRFVLNTEL